MNTHTQAEDSAVSPSERRLVRFRTAEQRGEYQDRHQRTGKESGKELLQREFESACQDVHNIANTWLIPGIPFLGKRARTRRRLRNFALQKIELEHPELKIGRFRGMFNRAQRNMFLQLRDEMAKSASEEIAEHLDAEGARINDLRAKIGTLRPALLSGCRLRLKRKTKQQTKEKTLLTTVAKDLEKGIAASQLRGKGIPPEAVKALEAEELIRGELIRNKVVDPRELNQLFKEHIEANFLERSRLSTLVRGMPSPLRELLIDGLARIRAGSTSWLLWRSAKSFYRALRLKNEPHTFIRMRRFFHEYPSIIGTRVALQIPSRGQVEGHVEERADGLIALVVERGEKQKERIILDFGDPGDPEEAIVRYRDTAGEGKARESKLTRNDINVFFT